jgi:ArsR family transcriptional regulator
MTLAAATDLMKLMADPTRVRLMALLSQEELTVAELMTLTHLTQSRISSHLGRLRDAGLVEDRRAGVSSFYRTTRAGMPEQARDLWHLVRDTARDPLLDQDSQRLREVIRARHGGRTWADSVAGQMERHYSPGRTWDAALRGLLGLLHLGRVLDIGAGDSALAELIAPRARAVTCLDINPRLLTAGRRRLARLPHVSFTRGDMHTLPFPDERFDEVLMMACLCHAHEPARAIAEAARVLRPGGDLVAVTLRRHEHRRAAERYDHIRLGYLEHELHRMLSSAGLEVELCGVTSRERRRPHFEILTVHAHKRKS